MMLGLYPSQTCIRTNGCQWEREDALPATPLPELMRRAGYQTAGFGKTHWNHSQSKPAPSTRGFETRIIGQPSDSELYEEGAVMMGEADPQGLARYFAETELFGAGEENALGYIGCRSEVPPGQHRDGWVARQCMDFIESGIDESRPLFLYLSFLKPHAGFNVIPEFDDLYSLDDIPEVAEAPGSVNEENHLVHSERSSPDFLQSRRDEWKETWSKRAAEEKKRTTLRYWANCSWLDDYFGQVLSSLEARGRLENALIVFCSDHGDLMGERDDRFSKYCLYDSSIRVPLVLSGSALPERLRGTIRREPVELVDLLPTLCKIAGVEPNGAVGHDLLDSGKKRVGTFCEYHGSGFSRGEAVEAYAWRTTRWKLIRYRVGDEWRGELYDLQSDPHEWTNLYDGKETAPIRERMTAALQEHLVSMENRN